MTDSDIKTAFRVAYETLMENKDWENTIAYFDILYENMHKKMDQYPDNRLLSWLMGSVFGYIAEEARKEKQ